MLRPGGGGRQARGHGRLLLTPPPARRPAGCVVHECTRAVDKCTRVGFCTTRDGAELVARRSAAIEAREGGPVNFETDRSYQLPVSPDELWQVLRQVDDYRSWWPWLRRFDAVALAAGEVWECLVHPPLPYRVRFAVVLEEVRAPGVLEASITGNVLGRARIEITDHPLGSEARLVSSLRPSNGVLKMVGRLGGPVARFGHDWVLDRGAKQFIARALPRRDHGPTPTTRGTTH